MKLHRIKEIIFEEVSSILEASITKNFTKAVEALQKIQLAQQKLRKAFVAEKDPKKKEKLKADLIKIHKSVQKAELEFNQAIKNEPIDYMDEGKLNEKADLKDLSKGNYHWELRDRLNMKKEYNNLVWHSPKGGVTVKYTKGNKVIAVLSIGTFKL